MLKLMMQTNTFVNDEVKKRENSVKLSAVQEKLAPEKLVQTPPIESMAITSS